MTVKEHYKLSVIVAEEHAAGNLEALLVNLVPAAHPDVEFLLYCHDRSISTDMFDGITNCTITLGESATAIPLLWSKGIRDAKAPQVALLTAHCIPKQDWLSGLLEIPLDDQLVAVGGAIENDPASDAIGRAIYLLRYVRYTAARPAVDTKDIAADNAMYRTADILAYPELLDIGFWEPVFHRMFADNGLVMRFNPKICVMHRNQYSAGEFIKQRLTHGAAFGRERASNMSGIKRFLMIVASPLIPVVFLKKIIDQSKLDPQFSHGLNGYFFWLVVFVLAWSMGETWGYITGGRER